MFRRLADRVSDAVSNVVNGSLTSTTTTSPSTNNTSSINESNQDVRIAELCSMGFRPAEARHALRVTSGDMQRATDWLLEHGTPIGIIVTGQTSSIDNVADHAHATSTNDDVADVEDEIQKAIQASLEQQQNIVTKMNKNEKNSISSRPSTRTAAAKKAGQAAVQRSEKNTITNKGTKSTAVSTTTTTTTSVAIASHPKVQIPKRLSQHDKEDVILRCAARIAPHPMAVDTLLRSLKTIQSNPKVLKYQSIDTTTTGFQRSLNAPGVLDFLRAMNFHPSTSYDSTNSTMKVLKLSILDPATFYLGISSLEQIQETSVEYKQNKSLLQFDKEIQEYFALGDSDMNEAIQRAEYMSKCPSESTTVGGSQVTIECSRQIKITRKFDGDDTLEDVIHWLGGHASIIPTKLQSGEWHIIDKNHPNGLPYKNINDIKYKTLQYIGCWPSGRLAIVPTTTLIMTNDHQDNGTVLSTSRGLGAGPVDHL